MQQRRNSGCAAIRRLLQQRAYFSLSIMKFCTEVIVPSHPRAALQGMQNP